MFPATYYILFILASLVLVETLVFFGMCFETPIQEPIVLAFSHISNKGKGPLILRSIGILLFAVLVFWVYNSIAFFRSWRTFHGPINWSDGVTFNVLILQASLLGFSLFAWMVLDKLHHIIMEQLPVWNAIKAEEKLILERKLHLWDHRKVLLGKVAALAAKMKKPETDCQMKANRAQAAGAAVSELKNQLEKFRLKYERLLDYNQTLRNQLWPIRHKVQKVDESDRRSNLKSQLGWRTVENKGETVDFENVMESTTKCGGCLYSVIRSSSSPRHRRPIYISVEDK